MDATTTPISQIKAATRIAMSERQHKAEGEDEHRCAEDAIDRIEEVGSEPFFHQCAPNACFQSDIEALRCASPIKPPFRCRVSFTSSSR